MKQTNTQISHQDDLRKETTALELKNLYDSELESVNNNDVYDTEALSLRLQKLLGVMSNGLLYIATGENYLKQLYIDLGNSLDNVNGYPTANYISNILKEWNDVV